MSGRCEAVPASPGRVIILADMNLATHGRPISRPQVRDMFEDAGLSIRSQTSPVMFFTFTVGKNLGFIFQSLYGPAVLTGLPSGFAFLVIILHKALLNLFLVRIGNGGNFFFPCNTNIRFVTK